MSAPPSAAATFLAALAPLLALVPAPVRPAERPMLSARVDVTLASRFVRVLDERNCIAPSVELRDLRFLANRRPLVARLRRRDSPLRVSLLVDASFSMVGRRLELAEIAARRLIERLARERKPNELATAFFDERIFWLTPEGFSTELCEAALRLGHAEAQRGTALWHTLDAALAQIESRPSSLSTAIVVITDGQDTEDRARAVEKRALKRALALDVPIFAISIPPMHDTLLADEASAADEVRCARGDWKPRGLDSQRKRLLEACTSTGGAMYTPRHNRVKEAVDFVFSQLRSLHEIEAELPPELAALDVQLEVTAARPGLTVLAGRDPASPR